MALLLTMPGPTSTLKSPELAPVGIVMVIDVALHELIVADISLRSTTLLPCEAPNPEPETTTWLPADPVVADRLVITGTEFVGVLIDTLSNVAVDAVVVLPLLTPNPM
jgi:hypothetical protein